MIGDLSENGFTFFSSDAEVDTLELAVQIGVLEELSPNLLIQNLVPRSKNDSRKNTYSGVYGFCEFPFHTDLAHWFQPPRYILLRNVSGESDVVTGVMQSASLINLCADGIMSRALFRPRKRRDGELYFIKIKDDEIFRWDTLFIEPANKAGNFVRNLFIENIDKLDFDRIIMASRGDSLLLDNWKVLHNRSTVLKREANRTLQRVYLSEVNNGFNAHSL